MRLDILSICYAGAIPLNCSFSMEDISKRLQQDLADVTWSDLMPHAKRDALIVVHAPLDLIAVGVAIAQDDVNSVQHWISEALIHKPSAQELNAWNVEPTQLFKTLIVQPFVLVQEAVERSDK